MFMHLDVAIVHLNPHRKMRAMPVAEPPMKMVHLPLLCSRQSGFTMVPSNGPAVLLHNGSTAFGRTLAYDHVTLRLKVERTNIGEASERSRIRLECVFGLLCLLASVFKIILTYLSRVAFFKVCCLLFAFAHIAYILYMCLCVIYIYICTYVCSYSMY